MVNYPTAMDTFVIICFGSVFAALLEFAIITFISLYIGRYKAQEEKNKEALEKLVTIVNKKLKSSDNINGILCNELISKIQRVDEALPDKEEHKEKLENNTNLETIEIIQVDDEKTSKNLSHKGFRAQLKSFIASILDKLPEKYRLNLENCYNGVKQKAHQKLRMKPVPEMYIYSNTDDACEYIDSKSRIYFPSAFIFVMSVYWVHYLYIYQDETVYKDE